MASRRQLRIGIDTGGTFTDIVADAGDDSALVTHKVLSTPDDPSRAVLEGLAHVLSMFETHGGPSPESTVVHGSTVATNAVLEGKGAVTAFVTTEGFEDTLHIARQNRPELYALSVARPEPPVARERCLGVPERIGADGVPVRPLEPEAVEALIGRIRALRVESVAISLLHSYAVPDHERRIADALRSRLPDVHVTVSHEILPEFREYERASTCVVNAVVAPPMTRYINRLVDRLGHERMRIMGSGGGSLPPREVERAPVQTILSGPAGGVLGAWAVAKAAGERRIIAFDMGGTSTDVSLCDGGLSRTTESEIAGLPLRLPIVDIHTVGAGGGSVARVDAGGALHVGPGSMGADPGPACYGRQQRPYQATVTDAHAVLGFLPPDQPLSGTLRLDVEAAREAVDGIARQIGASTYETARGILLVADVTMARAVRRISVERGHDPREFALLPFGGAGGLHACRLAERLGMRRVVLPPHAGVLSALGMLTSAPLYSFSRSLLLRLDLGPAGHPDPRDLPEVRQALGDLRRSGIAALEAEGLGADARILRTSADLRYEGQSYELTVSLDDGDPVQAFAAQHQALYGYQAPEKAIELVTLRLRASGPERAARLAPLPPRVSGEQPPVRALRIPTEGGSVDWIRVDRSDLRSGDRMAGPVLVTEYATTTVVPEGWTMSVGPLGHLVLYQERGAT